MRWVYENYREEIIDLLLANRAELPTRGNEERRLLHKSASNGDKSLVELLIEKVVDITTKNDNGGTLLCSVTAGDLRKLAEMVISKGMNINEMNRYATSPSAYRSIPRTRRDR